MTRASVTFLFLLACGAQSLGADEALFPQGSWSATAYGSYTHNFSGERAKMGAGTVGIGYYIFDNVALNAELSGYYNDQSGPDDTIFATDLLLRHHALQRGRFSLFLDVGGGLTYADYRSPPGGTYFNFMEETGVGATFQVRPNLHLIGGVRFFHMSNARLEGPARNPSINATQGYVGLMLRF